VTEITAEKNNPVYCTPLLDLLILLLMVCEKMLAHTYTAMFIYVIPAPWKFIIPGNIGLFGMFLIIKEMGKHPQACRSG